MLVVAETVYVSFDVFVFVFVFVFDVFCFDVLVFVFDVFCFEVVVLGVFKLLCCVILGCWELMVALPAECSSLAAS